MLTKKRLLCLDHGPAGSGSGAARWRSRFGNCDLATVTAPDAALAAAAATWVANQVHCRADIQPTLDKLSGIAGISGAIIIKDDAVGLVGNLPKLIRHHDTELKDKISRDRRSMLIDEF